DIVKDRGGDEALAEAIGYGAVKYSDLSHDPITDIDFSWDKALALEGNSGPYLQYAYARVCSLLDKAGAGAAAGGAFHVTEPAEKRLALQLLEFPGAVRRAADAYKPSVLADYLFQTAQLYSSFYQNSPILKSAEAVRQARLRLVALFGEVLKTGLGLLGIETPRHI
ncbi:MAG TPA: arginine--tRNA ligase, partial [Verrucomicrobia bacterium]|nr:arginine--tRNA ligase [Verrucomicrobiota bacterium]